MSQGFRLRYDEMRNNDPSKKEEPEETKDENYYSGASHARSLCLVWPEGRRMFFNYAYFISADLNVSLDKNCINLHFSAHHVSLTGYRLEELFMSMMEHVPRIVYITDERYILVDSPEGSVVTNIIVENK